jgi:hypothetical protein
MSPARASRAPAVTSGQPCVSATATDAASYAVRALRSPDPRQERVDRKCHDLKGWQPSHDRKRPRLRQAAAPRESLDRRHGLDPPVLRRQPMRIVGQRGTRHASGRVKAQRQSQRRRIHHDHGAPGPVFFASCPTRVASGVSGTEASADAPSLRPSNSRMISTFRANRASRSTGESRYACND